MSGYAVNSGGSGSPSASQVLPSLVSMSQQQQELLNAVLTELQAQSAMTAQAFDLYDGPEGYRTNNQANVIPSPSP